MKITKEKIAILNELGRKNFLSILDKFGVKYSDRGRYINSTCPLPSHPSDADNPTAFSFDFDLGKWACWTCHCEEKFGRDIVGFMRGMLEKDLGTTVKWLTEFLESNLALSIDEIDVNSVDIVRKKKSEAQLIIHKTVPETLLTYLKPPNYLLQRGFTEDVLTKYQAGYWERPGTYMNERIIIPVRDHDNRLIGFTGRLTIEKEEWSSRSCNKDRTWIKWLHGTHYIRYNRKLYPFKKEAVVFNLYNVANRYDSIILVEGPLDGFKLEMAGISNWGASLGSSFSPIQQKLLLDAGIRKIYLAFDPDKAGRKFTMRSKKILGTHFDVQEIDVPAPYDIGSLSPTTIREIVRL